MIAGLATYRISLLVTKEDGPAFIFERLRKVPSKKSATYEWLTCIFCFSMSASAVVCFLMWLSGLRQGWPKWFIIWCALSAFAIAMNQRFTKGPL